MDNNDTRGVKRLYRTEGSDARFAGVCGGIAEYFNIDPTIVRVLWVLFVLCAGSGILVYIIMALIVPKKSEIYPGY